MKAGPVWRYRAKPVLRPLKTKPIMNTKKLKVSRFNTWQQLGCFVVLSMFGCLPAIAQPQQADRLPPPRLQTPQPTDAAIQKENQLIDTIIDPELVFRVDPSRSRIVKTKLPINRIAITDPSVVDVNEFNPNEIEIIGLKSGETTLSLWFQTLDGREVIIRYLVKVGADEALQTQAEVEYGKLQTRINEMFPNSFVQLFPVADKLIIRGQARDSREAAEILAVVSGQSVDQSGNLSINVGSAANLPGIQASQTTNVISLLNVPGEQQVMLKVRIAELNRNATRELGMDFSIIKDSWSLSNFLGAGGNIRAILDNGDVQLFIRALSSNGVGKILAEPTLVTISGQPATFIAGGEFAVPTAVGIDGIGAVSTTFQGFGTQLTFTPTVIDRDKIRLNVAPSVSDVNQDIAVDGVPGLDIRGVTTTVDLREGQWLAIAGLIQDESGGSRTRIPFIGDIPIVGAAFGNQNYDRNETELVIMVSPELVHPLEPEHVPLFLPGMEVTEPSPKEFFLHQQIEGLPGEQFRSTVWPAYRHQLHHQKHDKCSPGYQNAQDYYITGPHGYSK